MVCASFFFFQAEDGIRDLTVTGVQTCALPISIRAVTQNRAMSACLGVRAGAVDAVTFGLGAGLAGLAGCALTQIGNVGPSLGQNYIVDSFMVVVTGGGG